jgi:hypothetical protein
MAHDVSGIWNIKQSNGYTVQVNIEQPRFDNVVLDGPLSGTAQEYTPHGTDISNPNQTLQDGKLDGDAFVIRINWGNDTLGHYSGFFDPFGRLSGVTYDEMHPGAQATWFRQDV